MNFGKFFRTRSGSIALVAIVIVAVILINAGMTALCSGALLYADLSSEGMYTLTEATQNLLDQTFEEVNANRLANNQEPVKVEILFCADPDVLVINEQSRYVYYTALNLQDRFPETVQVKTVNVLENPSAVDAYRTNTYSSIYQTNVIVSSGSEFRLTTLNAFYITDTESDEIWAYDGEKRFTSYIMAVTKAESPICCFTVNHGEPFGENFRGADGNEKYSKLIETVKGAGYDVQFIDLENEEIPENCRLILTFDPQSDFTSGGYLKGSSSEISKLDAFLNAAYSYLVFVDADTPYLPNLEEFLGEWGISFGRYRNETDSTQVLGNYRVKSDRYSVDSQGLAVIASYEEEGTGASLTDNMQKYGLAPKVVFANAMPILYSDVYEVLYELADSDEGTGAYSFGSYSGNNHYRAIYDVFRSNTNSMIEAVSGGTVLTDGGNPISDSNGNYKLMTLTRENRSVSEGKGYSTVNNASNVCAIGSTEFASNELLGSGAYGNVDVLLATLRGIGKEIVPVGLSFKPLYDSAMTESNSSSGEVYYTEAGNVATTVILVLLPGIIFSVAGVTVLVRRKFGH